MKQRPLEHGDRLRIGDSQFLFLVHEGDVPSKSSEVEFDDRKVVSGSTIQFRFNDALYLMARDLSALMKVSTTINAMRGLEELQKKLLELLFEVVPAKRGAILLKDMRESENEQGFSSVLRSIAPLGQMRQSKLSGPLRAGIRRRNRALNC